MIKNTKSRNQLYLEASGAGLLRSLVGLPLEHPFDSIKSRLQAEVSRDIRFTDMVKEIYRKQGIIRGFYAGFIPNAAKGFVKQAYRWPLMLILPEFYNSVYPSSIKTTYPSAAKISTGITLAAIDAFLICPFERIKVLLQTKSNKMSIRKYFSQSNESTLRLLFKGMNSLFYRQMISWVSFLYSDLKIKQWARKYQGTDDNKALDNGALVGVSILVGIVNVVIIMPFDLTKTLYQQYSGEFRGKKLTETIKIVHKQAGLGGFYVGWQPRVIQYMINSVITVTALEKMEQKMKDSRQSI